MLITNINGNDVIYGTVRECVKEVFRRIDFMNAKFPDFDFASWVEEDITQEEIDNAKDIINLGSSWFGCKDLGSQFFDSDTISVMFGHYGGGGINAVEIIDDDSFEDFLRALIESTEDSLREYDYTIFEFIGG